MCSPPEHTKYAANARVDITYHQAIRTISFSHMTVCQDRNFLRISNLCVDVMQLLSSLVPSTQSVLLT